MTQNNKITFNYVYQRFSLKSRNPLKEFLLFLFKNEKKEVSHINYIFCDDDYLLKMNIAHLNHSTFTDILTFDLSNFNEPIISDIYISIDRIKENSKTFKTTFTQELHRVIFHGALHLCGYNDKDILSKKEMTKKEDFYLNKYFVPRETL